MGSSPEQLQLPFVGSTPRAQRAINAVVKAQEACEAEAKRFAAEQEALDRAKADKAACEDLEKDLNAGKSVHVALLTGQL